jgi:hypothetical protein
VTEVLGLTLVAWLVYATDALWWVGPHRIVLSGREPGRMRARLGPAYALRNDSGVFIPRLIPTFNHHFEVGAIAQGSKPVKDAVILAAAQAAVAAARPLQRLSTLLWGFCFLVAPLLMMTLGLRRVWIALVAVLFASALAIVICFAQAWRRLNPHDAGGWKGEALPMILSPLAAICAGDTLTRTACSSFGGLAVVSALATEEEFLRIARLYYFAPDKQGLDALLAAKGLTEALLRPPARTGAEMEGYCPRCHTQLVRPEGDCPECLDVPIVAFSSARLSGAPSDTFQSAAQR